MAKNLIQFKKMFFDSKEVIAATDKAARSVLSKIGAFIRREAKSSIKPGGRKHKTSLPGQPPRSQTGLLKRFIFFGYDTSTQSVVVGPAKLGGVKGKDAPHTLEYGGSTESSSFYANGNRTTKRVTIAARPYMTRAMRRTPIASLWRDSIREKGV